MSVIAVSAILIKNSLVGKNVTNFFKQMHRDDFGKFRKKTSDNKNSF